MPTLEHEAPLVVLREQPSLVPALLREALGMTLPAFARVELDDADLTQALPAERRADLVVHLRRADHDGTPVMGVIVEVQRTRDEDKRWAWPAYAAALHARSRCPICLVVLAVDEAIARWAARPITSLQLGSPFVPLVIGPAQIPRVTRERAAHEPWLAILSALTHGNRKGGEDVVRAAATALETLPRAPAGLCYDLMWAALNEAARRVLEDEMQSGKYEYRSDFARRYYGEGREDGQRVGELDGIRSVVVALLERRGPVSQEWQARLDACSDPTSLRELAVELSSAADETAIATLLARLPAG